jgi:hypothetical protein
MKLFLDSFWRAVAYCLHPRVIFLSFLPLILMIAVAIGLGYFYWDPALQWVRAVLESSSLFNQVWGWLEAVGVGKFKVVAGPLIVVFAVTPVIIVSSLLLVALLMTPALVRLVGRNRFPQLERKQGSSMAVGLLWSLSSTVLALAALVVSSPLWLVPPLILILPPLIWGWLTYRVMAFDALAEYASTAERRAIFRRHRGWLLAIGVLSGYMGAAPSLVWASGVLFATMFVILVPVAIWIYTLVFAFASLWFSHYCLAALQALRDEANEEPNIVMQIADPTRNALQISTNTVQSDQNAPN